MPQVSTVFLEGQSAHRPPLFCGQNFSFWKARMRHFIQMQEVKCWKMIVDGYKSPMMEGSDIPKDENEYSEEDLINSFFKLKKQ